MTGRAAASKRRRATGSSSHSTPELRPSLSTSQHRLRMDHDDQPFSYEVYSELLMNGMVWPQYGGQSSNDVLADVANPVPMTANTTAAPSKQARKKICVSKKLPNFSPTEDQMLVRSYLEVSGDAAVGTNQRKESLWSRIMNQYNEKRGYYPEQTLRSAQSRWDSIELEVGKFCGYYYEVLRGNHSGMCDADKTSLAASDFGEGEGHPFVFLHCWEIMKDEPKWHETIQTKGSVQIKGSRQIPFDGPADPFVDVSASVDLNSPLVGASSGKRPLGWDATKSANKKASSASSSSIGSEFAANLKEMNINKSSRWDLEYARRISRDQQLVAIETKKHEELVSL